MKYFQFSKKFDSYLLLFPRKLRIFSFFTIREQNFVSLERFIFYFFVLLKKRESRRLGFLDSVESG